MRKKRKCRICGANKFKPVLDMGEQPLVNSLLEKKDLGKPEFTAPLLVEQCQKCFLVQIVNTIDAEEIYRDIDYLFYSSDMPGLADYFKGMAQEIKDKYLKVGDFVVEIGSNDGVMLEAFKGYRLLGVDPASNVVLRALKRGIPTLSEFFTAKVGRNILKEYGSAEVIYGCNCIAHTDNLLDLLEGVAALLSDTGVFVVECNYWGAMVKNQNYSLIYHDHFSYFTVKDWINAANKFNLQVFDAEVTPAQNGSLRVFIDRGHHDRTERFLNLIEEEVTTNLASYKICQKYDKEAREKALALGKKIKSLKKQGKTVAGYGAAAKGLSILSLAGITNEIDFFVDDSPAKQGRYTPLHHVPVVKRNERKDPDVFVITAPNYAKVIMDKEKDFKGEFIIP